VTFTPGAAPEGAARGAGFDEVERARVASMAARTTTTAIAAQTLKQRRACRALVRRMVMAFLLYLGPTCARAD
jgi:hypothetical protein